MIQTDYLLSWTAPERPPHARGLKWYLAASSVVALLLIHAVWTGAWTFVVVLVLLAVVYGLLHGKPPLTHTVSIAEQGLTWDKKVIPWGELSGFWMLQGPGYIEVHIERKRRGSDRFIVQTGECAPVEIANALSRFLPSFPDRREKLLDYIIRICKL